MPAALRIPRRSKFNVDMSEQGRLTRTYREVVYDSAAEARYAAILDLRVKAGELKEWYRQIRYPLIVNEQKICEMRLDFKLHHWDGSLELVDVKGRKVPVWALKEKLFRALYPKVKLTIVNARNVA